MIRRFSRRRWDAWRQQGQGLRVLVLGLRFQVLGLGPWGCAYRLVFHCDRFVCVTSVTATSEPCSILSCGGEQNSRHLRRFEGRGCGGGPGGVHISLYGVLRKARGLWTDQSDETFSGFCSK